MVLNFSIFLAIFPNHVNLITLLTLSSSIFLIGGWGMMNPMQNSIINLLISFELMVLGVSLNFIFLSLYLDDFNGQIMALLILTVAGAESALGLAIVLAYFRLKGDLNLKRIESIKA
jgi:NADH-quinone oxidoreductase subunit K